MGQDRSHPWAECKPPVPGLEIEFNTCLSLSYMQVTVKMYKRGSHGWLGKSLNATATIPSNTFVIFKISGEEDDAKIPASTIHSITLSI